MTYPAPGPFPPPGPQWHQQPVPPRPPATNVAAIIAITAALVGLLIVPILLGPIAIVAGVVGEHQARTEGYRLAKVALLAIVIGSIITLIALDRFGNL